MSFAPEPQPRRKVHLRRITCEGFRREDGLFEIEGLLLDSKPAPLQLVNREVPANEPVHQMRVRMTIDPQLLIVDIQAFSEHTPYPDCAEVEAGYRQLIGTRIERGFSREVKRVFRGTNGCTHMTELLGPMASTAFQIVWARTEFDPGASPLGGCHALRLDGHIVKTYFPQHKKEPAA